MRAGSSKPIELHGNIMRNRCLICSEIYTEIKLNEDKRIPQHAECNGMLRPDVVWFGENLPQQALSEADEAINSAEVFYQSALRLKFNQQPLCRYGQKTGGLILLKSTLKRLY